MLRFCRLASHKNNLIIDDFESRIGSDESFLHERVGRQNANFQPQKEFLIFNLANG